MIACPRDVIAAAIRQSIARACVCADCAVPVPCSNVNVVLTQEILPHWNVDYCTLPGGSLEVWGEDETGAEWRITLHVV